MATEVEAQIPGNLWKIEKAVGDTVESGDVLCEIELWDSEWREGRARECGFAIARVHGGGFVPDPPVDEPSP